MKLLEGSFSLKSLFLAIRKDIESWSCYTLHFIHLIVATVYQSEESLKAYRVESRLKQYRDIKTWWFLKKEQRIAKLNR